MKKSDLKNGMVVECRNGKKYMYLETENFAGIFMNQEEFNFGFSDDLTHCYNESCDIMKIYQAEFAYQLIQESWDEMQLIWDREEPREMTSAEIEKELGYQVKIVERREESECKNS